MLPKMHGLVLSFLEEPRDEPSRERIAREWLDRIAPHCSAIRSNYNLPAKPAHFADMVHGAGLKYVGGAWIGHHLCWNLRQIDLLVEEARKGRLDIGLVGNETLKHGYATPRDLVCYLKSAQKRIPSVPLTIAEDVRDLLAYPEVIEACDSMVGVHIYPFWAGVHINCALDYLDMMYDTIKQIAGKDKKVVILETGWPTEGGTHGEAVASIDNALQYICEATSWGKHTGVEVFIFEAMNELWKKEVVSSGGIVGPHFGIWHADGRPKERMHEPAKVEAAE